MILSLLSNPQLIVVAWAAQPNIQSGTVSDGPQWPCKKSRNLNVFDYRVRDLWLVYGAFIFLAAISILFGMKAVQQNAGHFKKNRFSAIVAATRGPELDSVAWRTDAHGRMPRGVGKTRLGYGIARQGMGGQRGSYVGRGVDDGFGEMFYRSEIDRAERGVWDYEIMFCLVEWKPFFDTQVGSCCAMKVEVRALPSLFRKVG